MTGLGAVTPVGNDVTEFWQSLISGKCGIAPITRFDSSTYKVKLAAEVKDFDASLYMSKSEIKTSDLFTQYAIAAASQAVKDSEIESNINSERFGVYFGSGIGGIETFSTEMDKLMTKGNRKVSPYFIPMLISNMASGNIAIKFKAEGPCLPVVTACATGTNAIGEAFRAIKFGYADAIITGGSEASITRIGVAGFENMLALNTSDDPRTASIPFDKRRSGFVIGEGAGAMILEEYEHALKRGAKIYAEVCGYGCTCDAHHITAPNPDATGASRAIILAINEANMKDEESIYINAHGTSTPLNDVSETKAIKKALGNKAYKALVSSTKSMTGHMLGAAGAVEAIVSVLAMKEEIVPPTIGLTEQDPECDLDYVANVARKAKVNLVLSTSLGFGGHNACLAFTRI